MTKRRRVCQVLRSTRQAERVENVKCLITIRSDHDRLAGGIQHVTRGHPGKSVVNYNDESEPQRGLESDRL
jgi:hypothetical protein